MEFHRRLAFSLSSTESIRSVSPSRVCTRPAWWCSEMTEEVLESRHNHQRCRRSERRKPIQRVEWTKLEERSMIFTSSMIPLVVCDWLTVLRLITKSWYSKRVPRASIFGMRVSNRRKVFSLFIKATKVLSATTIWQLDCSARAKAEAGYSECESTWTSFELGITIHIRIEINLRSRQTIRTYGGCSSLSQLEKCPFSWRHLSPTFPSRIPRLLSVIWTSHAVFWWH